MTNPRCSNGSAARKLRARVLAAYDTCALCGGYVDKSLKTPNPLSAEVDHIVPISQGGDIYSFSNAQLAHRRCNRLKSDGKQSAKVKRLAATQERVETSREW